MAIAFVWAIVFARWPIFKIVSFLEYLVFFRAAILMKDVYYSWDYMWVSFAEMTVSRVQILEFRVQCVVVDVHINQALQKKNN